MSRIRELTTDTLQLGIRSMSKEEAERVVREKIDLCTMAAFRDGSYDVDAALERLADPVFLTLDVDALDWSVVRATSTPEPGGFTWDEIVALFERIIATRRIVGLDVVELSGGSGEPNSAFAVAKVVYKEMGFLLRSHLHRTDSDWPSKPNGAILK